MSPRRPKEDSLWRNPFTLVTSGLAIIAVIVISFIQTNQTDNADDASTGSPQMTSSTTAETTDTAQASTDPASGLPIVSAAELPAEARDTLALIASGGPFPYDRDGVTFENREEILPDEDAGYYHEYTVVTPGSDDRGARRIIAGSGGELYYTDDHYESFVRIES